jgi:acyl carrier protein
MPRRNSPNDIKEIDDLNRLDDIVHDKRNAKRATDKKTRRDRHYQKQFIKNTLILADTNFIKMTKSEILSKLKTIVKPFVNNQTEFENMTESTDFINDLQINSANLVDIILDVEDAFEIVIDNDDMARMLDIKNTIDIIETKMAARQ